MTDGISNSGYPSRDDLLACGVARFLPQTRYRVVAPGYGRLTWPLGRRRIEAHLPCPLHPFLVPSPSTRPMRTAPQVASPTENHRVPPLGGMMFVDIESLGFIGRPLFLIGVLHARTSGGVDLRTDASGGGEEPCFPQGGEPRLEGEIPGLEVIQYLARDYSEEEAILRAFNAELAEADVWVTYNGRTFDLPFLELRAVHHRLVAPRPGRHLDLLPVARRLWGETLPDCRLKTLALF